MALRQDLNNAGAPPELRTRIMRSLDQETAIKSPRVDGGRLRDWRPQPFWRGAFGGIGGTAIAAGIAFFLLTPSLTNPLIDDLVSAHVRSLMPDHLIDVVSTDKHTVKPWFAGHTDVSPVAADFDSQGYRLIGGRADYAGVPTETSPYPISRYFNPQSCVSVRRDHHHLMIPLYGRPPDHI